MNVPASHPAPSSAPVRGAHGELRRIVKSANSGVFGESFGRLEPCWERLSQPPTEHEACQNETGRYAPLWNGPALRPAFVAQALGQAIMVRKGESSNFAAQSYRRGVSFIPAALLFNISI